MKAFIGILMIVAGVCLGIYVGIYLCLVCGIMDIVRAVQMVPVPAAPIGWGVAKIVLAGFLGWLTAIVLVFPGFALIFSANTYNFRRHNRW